jgi:autotransporter-associated beta strand protein
MFMAGKILRTMALTLALAGGNALAASQSEREVQTLGNFLSLQKIASKDGGSLRNFVKLVSTAYARAGYNDFAPEFRRSGGAIIAQFGIGAGKDGSKDARAALRRLEQALDKDGFIVLPSASDPSVPDYHGLAAAFIENAKVALKNVSRGKNVANTLRNNKGSLWLTTDGGGVFTFLDSHGIVGTLSIDSISGATLSVRTSEGLVKTDAGTLTLSGANTYTGATTVNGGTLGGSGTLSGSYSWDLNGASGTNDQLALGQFSNGVIVIDPSSSPTFLSLSSSINVLNNRPIGGSFLLLSGSNSDVRGGGFISYSFTSKRVAFPPAMDLPLDQNYEIRETLSTPQIVSGVDLPAGARIISINTQYLVPTGAIELPNVISYYAFILDNSSVRGRGNLTLGNSSGDFIGFYRLTGALTKIQVSPYDLWLAFPPGATIPDTLQGSLLLGIAYSTVGIELPAGTRIVVLDRNASVPAGAIVLPVSDFTLTPVPLPAE